MTGSPEPEAPPEPGASSPADWAGSGRTIGMALYGDLTYDSRVRREAATLAAAGLTVRLVCLGLSGRRDDLPEGVQIVVRLPTSTRILPGISNPDIEGRGGRNPASRAFVRLRWLVGYVRNLRAWGRDAVAAAGPVDAWHAHDLPALASIAPHVPSGVPLVYDSHELFLEAGTARRLPGIARRLLRRREAGLVRRAAAVVTVNAELARVLGERYRPREVVVVHNCPPRWSAPPGPDLLRTAAGIEPTAAVVLYHGSIGPDRGIEQLFEALLAPGLEDAHVVVLGPGEHRRHYEALVGAPALGGRAHVLPGVPPDELLGWVCRADVSGVLIGRATLNHYLSTPNKLFESIAAGVPVVASDFPAMRPIVCEGQTGPLGSVVDPADGVAVAAALRSILELSPEARQALRERCAAAARARWNWEIESSRLVSLYGKLLGSGSDLVR